MFIFRSVFWILLYIIAHRTRSRVHIISSAWLQTFSDDMTQYYRYLPSNNTRDICIRIVRGIELFVYCCRSCCSFPFTLDHGILLRLYAHVRFRKRIDHYRASPTQRPSSSYNYYVLFVRTVLFEHTTQPQQETSYTSSSLDRIRHTCVVSLSYSRTTLDFYS